jgi:hypothetical protein
MESFFNLSFLKYPITLIFNMIVVGFYLYIFPPKENNKVPENEFAAVNLNIPSADKKIEEKKSFGKNDVLENEEFSAAEIAKNEEIALNNDRTDFVRRTSKPYAVKTVHSAHSSQRSYQPRVQRKPFRDNEPTFTNINSSQNDNTYQQTHGRIIERLEDRIKELELRKKQSQEEKNVKLSEKNVAKNDGFTFKDQDLVPKNGAENDLQNPIFDHNSNRFYSNRQTSVKAPSNEYSTVKRGVKNDQSNILLKGRLVESKTVRNNSTIKIMLTESKIIGGHAYESGDIIGAKTHIQGDRLMLTVDGYIKNEVFTPIAAQVMDLDGLLGLKVSIDMDNEMQKNAWGQNVGSTLGSVNPLLVYNPQGNLGQTVGNQVVGSLVNQSLNGANQYVNAKIRDVKVNIKTGQQLYLLIKSNP